MKRASSCIFWLFHKWTQPHLHTNLQEGATLPDCECIQMNRTANLNPGHKQSREERWRQRCNLVATFLANSLTSAFGTVIGLRSHNRLAHKQLQHCKRTLRVSADNLHIKAWPIELGGGMWSSCALLVKSGSALWKLNWLFQRETWFLQVKKSRWNPATCDRSETAEWSWVSIIRSSTLKDNHHHNLF